MSDDLYAISDEAGAHGSHFIRVLELETGVQFHYTLEAGHLRFDHMQTEPPGHALPATVPDQVLGQARRYARQKGWL